MASLQSRWLVASVGAVGLAALTITSSMPWLGHEHPLTEGCPVDAKIANLDFTLKDLNGQDVTLADFKGKVILLDFWATWCPPCKAEIPSFVRLYDRYRSDGFEIVGVVVLDEWERVKPFSDEFRMNYTILNATQREDVAEAFGPMLGLPTNLLIDRSGRICAKHTGFTSEERFEAEINALL